MRNVPGGWLVGGAAGVRAEGLQGVSPRRIPNSEGGLVARGGPPVDLRPVDSDQGELGRDEERVARGQGYEADQGQQRRQE
ncbi:hypothetical protein GAR06_00826 [Micromonospora saelicesensis]|nr:hypothetical protein GAR06_00826 [Micromonospora saelicesensis]